MELHRSTLNINIPVSDLLEPAEGERGLLVLHGFTDHASSVRRRLLGEDPVPGYTVFTPNGFFPTPVQTPSGFKPAYAWYFRDMKTGGEMISPELAAGALRDLIRARKINHLRWTILGFSQGGFFAPYLMRAGLPVEKVIAVGAGFRKETYHGLAPVPVEAIHGVDDEIVPHDLSQKGFEEIRPLGFARNFHSMPGLGHTLNDEGRALVRQILSQP